MSFETVQAPGFWYHVDVHSRIYTDSLGSHGTPWCASIYTFQCQVVFGKEYIVTEAEFETQPNRLVFVTGQSQPASASTSQQEAIWGLGFHLAF